MNLFELALGLFLISNPLGNSPAILALVKDYPFARQRRMLLRETFFAFILGFVFQFIGEPFLAFIGVADYSLTLCGGALLLVVGYSMIFPSHEQDVATMVEKQEPYMVPIATPLLSGPGLLTFVMLYAKELGKPVIMSTAIILAYSAVALVMFLAPYLLKALGKRGLYALEQLMGLVLTMIGVEMMVRGSVAFINML